MAQKAKRTRRQERPPEVNNLTATVSASLGGFHHWVASQHFWALGKLHAELEQALFLSRPDLVPRHRWRYEVALGAICHYLAECGLPPHLVSELQVLAHALHDLDAGTVHSMLKPVDRLNRPTDSTDVWSVRAHIVIGAECLMDSGLGKKEVCAAIEKDMGFLRHSIAPTAKTLGGAAGKWIDAFRKGTVKNELALSLYADRAGIRQHWQRELRTTDLRFTGATILWWSSLMAARAIDEGAKQAFAQQYRRLIPRRRH